MVSKSIFQKIIEKEIPSEIVYEDEMCIVINDINPQAWGLISLITIHISSS